MRRNILLLVAMILILTFPFAAIAGQASFPAGLREIAEEAFMNDTSLEDVTLPEGIETIGSRAFAQSSVTRVYLPGSIKYIAPDAFDGCTRIQGYGPRDTWASRYFAEHNLPYNPTDIPVDDRFTYGQLEDGALSITGYSGTDSVITIPAYGEGGKPVTVIASLGFMGGKELTEVTVSEGILTIETGAFYGCDNLHTIHLPESVTEIARYAFENENVQVIAPEGSYAECWAITYGFNEQRKAPEIFDVTCNPQVVTFLDANIRSFLYMPFSYKIKGYGMPLTVKVWLSSDSEGSDKQEVGGHYGSYQGIVLEGNNSYQAFSDSYADTYYLWIDAENPYYSTSFGPLRADTERITDSAYITLTGLVTDPDGNPISGAKVQSQRNAELYTYTDQDGRWAFEHWNRQGNSNIGFSHADYAFNMIYYTCTQAGRSTEEYPTAVGTPLSVLSGSFNVRQISLAPGESRQVAGSVSVSDNADLLGRVTLTIDGYDVAGDDNDRYATVDLNSKYISKASLSSYPELTLDAGKAPLNEPGVYTVRLWANLYRNETGKLLDTITVIVDNSQSDAGSLNPKVISFTGPEGPVTTGETVEFTVTTRYAKTVTLIVDDVAYDTVDVTNNTAVVQRAFSMGGIRKIQFRANMPKMPSSISESMLLPVHSSEQLEAPQVTLSGSYNLKPMLTAHWQAVPNAEQYVIYTYYEGGAVKQEFVDGNTLSWQLDREALSLPGNYSVEVIATAYGYSQGSGSCLFTLSAFDEYDAYLQQSVATVFADAKLSEPLSQVGRDVTLRVLYNDGTASLVRFQDGAAPIEGFLRADQIGPAVMPVESALRCWYSRKNPKDPQSPLTITVWATRDMQSVEIIIDDQAISSDRGSEIASEPTMLKYMLSIPAATQTSTYAIHGYAGGTLAKTTHITIPPVQTASSSALAAPKLNAIAPLPAEKAAEITWTGVTNATFYTVSLTRQGVQVTAPFKVEKPECTLTAEMLKYPGTYQMTVSAGNSALSGDSASVTFTVSGNKTYRYLQAETYSILYSYNYISFRDRIEILSETSTAYKMRTISRMGKETILDNVPKDKVILGYTQYIPDTPPTFMNPKAPISMTGVMGGAGGTRTITVETNPAVEKAELYVDGSFRQSMTLQMETSYNAKWTCEWKALDGEHILTVKLTSANGQTEEQSVQHAASHRHSLNLASAVINQNEITEEGVAVSSGVCSICGESMAGYYITPAEAYPGIITDGNDIIISGTLNNSSLVIRAGNKGVVIMPSGSLTASSVNCNQLTLHGSLHAGSINAETLSVLRDGRLTMKIGETAKVRTFDFASSNNHGSLLTGGEMSISGNMSVQTPFQPGADHKTIFTSGKHLLQNSASTSFGILVVYSSLGDLGAKSGFTYQYLVLPKVQPGQYTEPQKPQVPEACAPYVSSNGRSINETRLTMALKEKEYSKVSTVKFKFENPMTVYSGVYFNVVNTTPNKPVLSGSAAVGIVQQIALDALADFSRQNQNSILSRILAAGGIDYDDYSYYDLNTGRDYRRIQYEAHVSGVAAGNGVSLGYLLINYTEWDVDHPETRCNQTYQLTPTTTYGKKTIHQIMESASWEGKKNADKAVEEAKKEVIKTFADFMVEISNYDELKNGYLALNTISTTAGLSQSDTQNLPLLKVYTDSGTMCVFKDNVSGDIPYSDLCNKSFRTVWDTIFTSTK